MHECTAK